MTYILYKQKKFRRETRTLIHIAGAILHEYAKKGYSMTLRQLYYQFVARDVFENTERNYKRLGKTISEARLAGSLDWDLMEDLTRRRMDYPRVADPTSALKNAAKSYFIDTWSDQKYRVEVWVEKEALAEVVGRAALQSDCPYFCCRGYVSQTAMQEASARCVENQKNGQATVILHLGDHDPSGIDMSRDIYDRLAEMARGIVITEDFAPDEPDSWTKVEYDDFTVERIALTMDQVEELNPPPNPAKVTDSRFAAYRREYGDESWELDALEPAYIEKLILDHIGKYVDLKKYGAKLRKQKRERAEIVKAAEEFARAKK